MTWVKDHVVIIQRGREKAVNCFMLGEWIASSVLLKSVLTKPHRCVWRGKLFPEESTNVI